MKKNLVLILLAIIIIAGVGIGIWYTAQGKKSSSALPAQPPVAQATYICNGDKTIEATFFKGESKSIEPGQPPILTGSVKLVLSDGQKMDLSQTISADGGRYANSAESFVFWNKGDGALVLENGVENNYKGCVEFGQVADWATYTSQLHNYEIKYPANWLLQKEVGHPPASIISYRWPDGSYCSFNLLIVDNDFDNSAEMDWYRQNSYKEETYTIAGIQGVKFSKFPVADSAPEGVIYFKNNSDRIDMVASADKYQNCLGIFNQMLDTYKLIK